MVISLADPKKVKLSGTEQGPVEGGDLTHVTDTTLASHSGTQAEQIAKDDEQNPKSKPTPTTSAPPSVASEQPMDIDPEATDSDDDIPPASDHIIRQARPIHLPPPEVLEELVCL